MINILTSYADEKLHVELYETYPLACEGGRPNNVFGLLLPGKLQNKINKVNQRKAERAFKRIDLGFITTRAREGGGEDRLFRSRHVVVTQRFSLSGESTV